MRNWYYKVKSSARGSHFTVHRVNKHEPRAQEVWIMSREEIEGLARNIDQVIQEYPEDKEAIFKDEQDFEVEREACAD